MKKSQYGIALGAFASGAAIAVIYLMISQKRSKGNNKTAPSPGSPMHRSALSRKLTGSPTTFMLEKSAVDSTSSDPQSPRKFQNLNKSLQSSSFAGPSHSSSVGFTPLTNTLREISSRPDTAPILVVGIAGGSGSGKTTLAQAIYTALGREQNVTFISHDSYYKDLSSWTMAQREKQNFDHPNSLDTDLLVGHILSLRSGSTALIPNYDFSTHSRTPETTLAEPRRVILVEGILIFTEPALTELLDVKIFVDTESDVRLIRRVTRDCQERGRSLEQVLEQYMKTVRPMHNEFVEPSKRQADIIVPVGINSVALSLITDHLKTAMEGGKGYMKTPFDEDNQRERGLGSRENSVGAKMNLMAEMR